jgi:Ca-activated chloride channel family protein
LAHAFCAQGGGNVSSPVVSALANFHFLRPLALLLLLAVPLFWLAWRNGRADAGAWRAAVDPHLLPHLIERFDGGPARAGITLAVVLWTLACVVLAGPAWEREPMPLYRNQSARVLVLELAPSMLAQDEKPNRLTRARFKLDDILTRSRDYQTALIGYGADAFVAAPLTDDVGTVRNLVDALEPSTMPVAGNATARAINAAAALIEQAGLRSGEIILLADSASADAAAAAREAHAHAFIVSVLSIGTSTGAPIPLAQGDFVKDASGDVVMSRLDEAGLRAIAAAGGGRYASLSPGAHDLDMLLAGAAVGISANEASSAPAETVQSARWRDRGPWLLLLLLPLALFGFRRGWLMTVVFAVVAPTPSAHAASFADLWQRSDQQAAAALVKGDAKQAVSVAHSPQWRGSAAYRAGDYASAANDYAKTHGADGAYNKGNALAKLGRYDEAIAAYDEALKAAPDMADAKANRKAVEDFLKQSKSQQNKASQQDKKQGSQGDSKDQQQKSDQDAQDKNQQQAQKDQQQGQQSEGDQKDQQQGQQQGGQQDPASQSSSGDEQKKSQEDAKNGADKAQQDQQKSASGAGADQQNQAAQGQAQKPDAAQQKALSKSIDKALADPSQAADKNAKPQPGIATQDEATRENQQTLEHWLQRVPDDPGGLLRRKFQLEYQRRQQRAGEGG